MSRIYIADTTTDTVIIPNRLFLTNTSQILNRCQTRRQREAAQGPILTGRRWSTLASRLCNIWDPSGWFEQKLFFRCILDNQGRKPKFFLGRNYWESLPDKNSTCCVWILQHFATWIWVSYDMNIRVCENAYLQMKDSQICSPETNTGTVFNYLTNGVGCSLVELECLTGACKVLRSKTEDKVCLIRFAFIFSGLTSWWM